MFGHQRLMSDHRAMNLTPNDPLALAATSAIQAGRVEELQELIANNPDLVRSRVEGRTLLHVASDWPGHFPNGAQVVTLLIEAGADASAAMPPKADGTAETPLHWAASSDDVAVLDALLDGGADIEAPGAIFTGGPAMSDAVVFAQWNAARRLLARGAQTTVWQSAALGLLDRVLVHFAADAPPSTRDVTNAFWHACRGGQRETAEYLLQQGAELNWIGYDHRTPLQVARESGVTALVDWLLEQGAR
ncbi:MAG TPA: ankyrin repeat domain-containing protein [Thermoanaerobaculia bacterium]|jgi:ankyrin repeat protein|nr:ankyrin repeat domain-containing protein [Thermoanaerobaculia bacterium]